MGAEMSLFDQAIVESFMPESYRKMLERQRQSHAERLAEKAVPWTPGVKWMPSLSFIGGTFKHYDLFPDVKPTESRYSGDAPKGEYCDSATGKFRYLKKTLPKATPLRTWYGSRVGEVVFDAPVIIPSLWERPPDHLGGWKDRWAQSDPWMSLTPAEIISMRGGTRLAKGHTVIAGLGLGYQLRDVLLRPKVSKVTLVELSQELVDWILPPLSRLLDPVCYAKLNVVVGDAYVEVPKLTADVALLDIFPGYGGNKEDGDRIKIASKNISKVWTWGSTYVS